MRSMGRRLAVLAVLILAGSGLTACSGPGEVTVDYTQDAVTVTSGQILVVDFGEINPSVGDDWVITSEPDSAVLGHGGADFTSDAPEGMTGAPGELVYRFTAVAPGTTVIAFEYRFRGDLPEYVDDRKTAEITVTVE